VWRPPSFLHTAQMGLTQGVLSAISAGMLIYAATVEMLGGDFVFGDVAGDHGHSHDHGHGHHDHGAGGEKKSSGTGRRVLAVVSLLAGVAGMGLLGIGE
jgi:solute carrier family 39 (zinc transporter), member 1/2/3